MRINWEIAGLQDLKETVNWVLVINSNWVLLPSRRRIARSYLSRLSLTYSLRWNFYGVMLQYVSVTESQTLDGTNLMFMKSSILIGDQFGSQICYIVTSTEWICKAIIRDLWKVDRTALFAIAFDDSFQERRYGSELFWIGPYWSKPIKFILPCPRKSNVISDNQSNSFCLVREKVMWPKVTNGIVFAVWAKKSCDQN